ncbi:MAG: PHB depolymerase family esterase [Bacteroidetes bacterium]|nr:PHB depolymerase family esterase [Bacteroidota bacterium]
MKNNKLYFLLLSIALFTFSNAQTVELNEIENFGKNPGNLRLFSFNTKNASNKSIVFVLHGCSQTAQKIEEICEWATLAQKNDFVLMYPQQRMINNPSLCFNWFLDADINHNGECQSIYNMMRYAVDTLKIDSTRIYFYGLSAGACMVQVMCANYPWLINTAATLAGVPFKTHIGVDAFKFLGKVKRQTPDEWGQLVRNQTIFYKGTFPKIIVMQGNEDKIVDFEYSNEVIKQWTNVSQCSDTATNQNLNYKGNSFVHRSEYENNQKEVKVIFYKIMGLGHQVPINEGKGYNQGGRKKMFSKDISFFSTFYIANDFNLIK